MPEKPNEVRRMLDERRHQNDKEAHAREHAEQAKNEAALLHSSRREMLKVRLTALRDSIQTKYRPHLEAYIQHGIQMPEKLLNELPSGVKQEILLERDLITKGLEFLKATGMKEVDKTKFERNMTEQFARVIEKFRKI